MCRHCLHGSPRWHHRYVSDSRLTPSVSSSSSSSQRSFRKTGTMGTIASQAEIDVWVQAPGSLLHGSRGNTPGKITPIKILRLYMHNPAIERARRWFAMPYVLKQFNKGNSIPTRSPRNFLLYSTIGLQVICVHRQHQHHHHHYYLKHL